MPRETEPLTLDEHVALGRDLKAMHETLVQLVGRLDRALAGSGRDGKLRRQAKRAQVCVRELRVQLEDNVRRSGLLDDPAGIHRIYFGPASNR